MVSLNKDNINDFIYSKNIESATDSSNFYFKIPSTWGNVFVKNEISNPLGSSSFDIPDYIIDDKIPVHILLQLKDLFQDIYKQHKSEVFAFILRHRETGEYAITVPEQTISYASVEYKNDVDPDYKLIANVHSHHTMGAFFSSTDDADDANNTSISIVLADLENFLPEMVIRTWAYNDYLEMNPFDVFDFEPYMSLSDNNKFNTTLKSMAEDIYQSVLARIVSGELSKKDFEDITKSYTEQVAKDLFTSSKKSKNKKTVDVKYDYRSIVDQKVSKIKYEKVSYNKDNIKEKKYSYSKSKYGYAYDYNYDDFYGYGTGYNSYYKGKNKYSKYDSSIDSEDIAIADMENILEIVGTMDELDTYQDYEDLDQLYNTYREFLSTEERNKIEKLLNKYEKDNFETIRTKM